MRSSLLLLLGTVLSGCGTYRGLGPFKTSSDYGSSRFPATYSAHGPFKLYWPVTVVKVNRGFRDGRFQRHEGVDLGGRKGMPIYAAHEGRVIYAGNGFHGYGNMILLEYNNEWASLYGHLDRFNVREGQTVSPGDKIGYMGATGHATGVHLHFEVMHRRQPTDPLALLTRPARLASANSTRRLRQN